MILQRFSMKHENFFRGGPAATPDPPASGDRTHLPHSKGAIIDAL